MREVKVIELEVRRVEWNDRKVNLNCDKREREGGRGWMKWSEWNSASQPYYAWHAHK